MFKYEIEYQNDNGIWVELKHWIRPIMNKSTLDETHDETQIFLSCSPIAEPFKPFTKFIINITELDENNNIVDIDTLYRVVIADEIEQVVFKQSIDDNGNVVDGLYDHDIRLAEATKELERYTVDNLSFTNEWKKAFSRGGSEARIVDEKLSRDFYDNSPLIGDVWDYALKGKIYVFRLDYPSATYENSNDKASIENTYVAKLLKNFNKYDINKIKDRYLTNSILTIPNIEDLNSADNLIYTEKANPLEFVTGFYRTDDYYVQINDINKKIYLIYPSGVSVQVNPEQEITLSQDGKYKIRYEITRNIRLKTVTKQYQLYRYKSSSESYSRWFTGLTTFMEQSFEVSANENVDTIDKLTISDILNKLVNATPTRFSEDLTLFKIDESVQQLYGSYEAPEMIFTNKNLWEALREVGGIINAIPYLKIDNKETWNNIAYLPLSSEETVSDKVEEEYCNSTSYYDSENYTASYDLSVDNMINPYSNYEGLIHEQGWYIAKTIRSEEVEISETSMNIETVYPIYTINHLYYLDGTRRISLDDYVWEKALYNSLVSNTELEGKAVSLYYTQGQPNIYGLNYKVSKNEYNQAKNVVSIRNILRIVLGLTEQQAKDIDLKNCRFVIEYTPFLKARIKYYKTNAPKLNIKTSMFQNQSANVVDANALGRKMVANIGRVGNLGYVDSLKVYSLNRIPLKGQRAKDGYFVSTVTTEYDQYHLLSSVQYTKDYQKISDFINIQNLQRFYEVSEKQSINRYINTHMFYIFGDSVQEVNKKYGLNQFYNTYLNYLTTLLIDQGENKKINASIIYNYAIDEDTNDEFITSIIYLNSNAIASGNNISIITDYLDNYGAGYQAKGYLDDETNAYMNRLVPYADNKGRISSCIITNVTDSNIEYGEQSQELKDNLLKLGLSLPAINDLYEDEKGNIRPTGDRYLVVGENYSGNNMPTVSFAGCTQTINVDKDSREILHFNQQHHFLTNDNNVIVGNAMTEYCRYIQNRDFDCRLVFLKNKIDNYEFKIKNEDIIEIDIDVNNPQTNEVKDLCTKITNSNIDNILSTRINYGDLFIQPMLNNDGVVFGLSADAYAWAIITNTNELIIGRNEYLQKGENGAITQRINMSVTSEY